MEKKTVDQIEPLVSVIIPSYNHQEFIRSSIESVINQTYSNIELIVIDDGSSDNSLQILNNLSLEYDFTLVTQKNRGICKTLNRGVLEFSSGDFIGILASDDIWDNSKIELQISELNKNPDAHFCYSQALSFTKTIHENLSKPFPRKACKDNMLNMVFLRQHVPAGTILFSRELFDSLNGFDEFLKEEDWDFVIRSASKTKLIFVDQPLLYYRSHDQNIMKTRQRTEIFKEKLKILNKNRSLVSYGIYIASIAMHFMHDIVISRILSLIKLRK